MIRILQVIGSLNNGGSQAMIMNIYRNIDRSKIQFDFVVDRENELYFAEEIKSLGGKIHILPTFNIKNAFKYRRAWDTFFKKNSEYKIIHGHVRSTASIYLKVAKKYGLATIAHSHSTSSGKGITALIKNVMQFPIRYISDYLMACSKFAGEWLFGIEACKKDNFFIINNAIDSSSFNFNKDIRDKKRKEFKIEGKYVLGHIGRFHPTKNHTFLIDVFKEVHDKNNNAVLLMIGDGEQFNEIKEKVIKLGLKEKVIFAGVRSDIQDILQAIDVFIFPSLFEGLGIAVIEAQASGVNCIVSDRIPQEAFITSLVKPVSLDKSPKEWAQELLNFKSHRERKKMSEEIKDAGYDIQESTKMITNLYLKIARHK